MFFVFLLLFLQWNHFTFSCSIIIDYSVVRLRQHSSKKRLTVCRNIIIFYLFSFIERGMFSMLSKWCSIFMRFHIEAFFMVEKVGKGKNSSKTAFEVLRPVRVCIKLKREKKKNSRAFCHQCRVISTDGNFAWGWIIKVRHPKWNLKQNDKLYVKISFRFKRMLPLHYWTNMNCRWMML